MKKKFICVVCGYVHEGDEAPEQCPLCKVGKDKFKELVEDEELKIDGLFSLRESISPVTLINGLETENGHVLVTRNMQTNLSGLFAAGDCTGRPYQYTKAAGEGNVAAHAVSEYLAEKGN